ncbi:MAG: hypothetical protein Kow0025_02770 [Thermodesulfovibrionales bacterium]
MELRAGRRVGTRLRALLAAAATAAASVWALRSVAPSWRFEDTPLHSALEGIESLAAVVMGVFLFQRKGEGALKYFALAAGFVGMGVLNGFLAAVHPSHEGALLRSAASLVGGLCFAAAWMPERWGRPSGWVLWAVASSAAALGFWSLLGAEGLPVMFEAGRYTTTASAINFTAGVLFLVGAARFLDDFRRQGGTEDLLFSLMASLLGLSFLFFEFCAAWDDFWWYLHAARLAAYALMLGWVIQAHQKTLSETKAALEARNRDLSELRAAEEKIRQSEARYRTLVENLPQRIFLKGRDLAYVSCNANYAGDLGIRQEEIAGKTDYDFYTRELAEKYRADDLRVMASGKTEEMEETYSLGGEALTVQTVKTPVRGAGGEVTALLGVFWDITERKKADEEIRKLNSELQANVAQLEAANRELEAFAYSVSHDLRAPLRSIDGFSQALLEDRAETLDPRGKEYLLRVRAAAQRMGLLIDDLLSLSRLSRAEVHPATVNLSAMARTVVSELRRQQPERAVHAVIEDGVTGYGDARLLKVALTNLMGNAWKFTGKKPEARVEFGQLQADGETAYFVRDNGAGFDQAYAGKLFAPFQRLHLASEFPGTGIGLATVQRVMSRHGGRVWAEGRPGEGATFYFTLGRK